MVVADIDGEGARAVAEEIGGVGAECDVTREDEVVRAIEAAGEPVDVYCANAGVADMSTEQAPDEVWDFTLGVNTLAHVYAARRLVPEWLERGSGCFVSTASAAGLLTQIGSATYAVTKHAAVAFAEWMSVTYGDRGIHVSCLCPMGMNTPLLTGGAQPDGEATATAAVKAAGAVLEPEDVADHVMRALREERFLILPHPEVLTSSSARGPITTAGWRGCGACRRRWWASAGPRRAARCRRSPRRAPARARAAGRGPCRGT